MVDAVSSFNVAPRVQQNQNVQTNQQQDPIVNYSNTNNTDTVEISSKKTTGEKAVIATVATLGVTGLALGIDALVFKGKGRKAILKFFKGEVDDVANQGKNLADDLIEEAEILKKAIPNNRTTTFSFSKDANGNRIRTITEVLADGTKNINTYVMDNEKWVLKVK